MFVKWIYIFIPIFLLVTMNAQAQDDVRDCLDGETWSELCKECKCFENGTYTCQLHEPSCKLGKCIKNVIVFEKNYRCHCSENNATVCVPLLYQKDLHGKPCLEDYYYYDSCTYCKCDLQTNVSQCSPVGNCSLFKGGTCNDEDEIFEDCYKCSCTFTKFRKCVPVEECLLKKEKPGLCYTIQSFYEESIQQYCASFVKQECHTDYGCPGQKKCCHVVDCFFRCTDPLFD